MLKRAMASLPHSATRASVSVGRVNRRYCNFCVCVRVHALLFCFCEEEYWEVPC